MSRVVVINHVTLDGGMQAPGRANEDTRDGLHARRMVGPLHRQCHGRGDGATDAAKRGAAVRAPNLSGPADLLEHQDSPFKDALNNANKYIASRTVRDPLPWPRPTLLEGDVADEVVRLTG